MTLVQSLKTIASYKVTAPKTNTTVKKVVSKKASGVADKLNNTMSTIGWAGLILALAGSIVYGAINAFSKKDTKPEQTEQVEQPEVIVIDKLTPIFDETV